MMSLKPSSATSRYRHFWGPLAGIQSSTWIVDSAILTADKYKPNFFYLYLPHLDYAAQKSGPESKAAHQAVADLDTELGKLIAGFEKAYSEAPLWLAASEYVISPVNDVAYPNRILREAGLLKANEAEDGEHLDFANSKAWATGGSPILARLCAGFRSKDHQEGRSAVRQTARHRRSSHGRVIW